jgi:hypothetical protein
MTEPTLNDHLANLTNAVEEYRRSVKHAQEHFSFEVEQLWRDQAELRDELHESITALANRIEGAVTRG